MAEQKQTAMNRRYPGVEIVKTVIPKYVRAKGPKFAAEYHRHYVLWHWRDIVGPLVARKVLPMGIKKQVLYLYCSDSSWRNEIRLMQPRILQMVNDYAQQKLIKELCFCRRWERPQTLTPEEYEAMMATLPSTDQSWQHDVEKMPVSEQEEAALRAGLPAADKELVDIVARLKRRQLQRNKARLAHGWHPCPGCGELVEPEAHYCLSCRQKHREQVDRAIRRTLSDIPWASLHEVREYVPEAEGAQVEEQRNILAQLWASRLRADDTESMAATSLAMLYGCVSPEHLTPEKQRYILYRLRRNMSWDGVEVKQTRREALQLDDRSEKRRAEYMERWLERSQAAAKK